MGLVRKLVIGLGNPGKKYEDTRHNIGFYIVDSFCIRRDLKASKKQFHSLMCKGIVDSEAEFFIAKPQTFMNLSGQAVKSLVEAFEIDLKNILVVCDDINIDLGDYRLRASGSHGGHNGLRSIIDNIGTQNFPRLRIGVGNKTREEQDLADYVLEDFEPSERKRIEGAEKEINKIIETFIFEGYKEAQDKVSQYLQMKRKGEEL